jgi:hypothetical protein
MIQWFSIRWLAARCLLQMWWVAKSLRRKGLRATLDPREHSLWFSEADSDLMSSWTRSAAGSSSVVSDAQPDRVLAPEVRRLGAICRRVAPLAGATCLPRSIVLARRLERHGYRPSLRIGVARIDGNVVAHAWIECDGKPVGEDIEQYVAFPAGAFRGALESLGTPP